MSDRTQSASNQGASDIPPSLPLLPPASLNPGTVSVTINRPALGPISVELNTEHLQLKSVTSADRLDLFNHLWNDPIVCEKYSTGVTQDQAYVDKRIATWTQRANEGDPFGALTVRSKAGEFIGLVIIGHANDAGTSQIAYLIRHDEWKKGYGTEAVTAATNELFPVLHSEGQPIAGVAIHMIEATAREDNPGSVRILEKAGFECLGLIDTDMGPRLKFTKSLTSTPREGTITELTMPPPQV